MPSKTSAMPQASSDHRYSHVTISSQSSDQDEARRRWLRESAGSTLDAIQRGMYLHYDLKPILAMSARDTRYYAPDSLLSAWNTATHPTHRYSDIMLYKISTLAGARLLDEMRTGYDGSSVHTAIGLLDFANPIRPGGGFRMGAQGQEESVARLSTLFHSLSTRVAKVFYFLHNHDPKGGYYSHAMIYSPNVVIMRDDQGAWVKPLVVDVVTSAAVNAGLVRQSLLLQGRPVTAVDEDHIADAMKERMARVLYLFETRGVRDIVLGAYGAGAFRNNVHSVARIWTELLLEHGARFRHSFGHVLFAVEGHQNFAEFKHVFAHYKS